MAAQSYGRSRRHPMPGAPRAGPVTRAFTFGQRRGNRRARRLGHHRARRRSGVPAGRSAHDETGATRGVQGRVHLDRRHRADRPAAVEDQDPRRTARSCRSGASTARAPTRRRAATPTACCSRCSSCPDPIRGGDDVLVMCEVLLTDMTPHVDQHAGAAAAGRREVRATRSRCSASSRSTRSSRTAARSASRRTASPRRRASTTAVSAPTRCSAVTSSRRTSTRASTPGSASRASTPRSCPASGSSRSAR